MKRRRRRPTRRRRGDYQCNLRCDIPFRSSTIFTFFFFLSLSLSLSGRYLLNINASRLEVRATRFILFPFWLEEEEEAKKKKERRKNFFSALRLGNNRLGHRERKRERERPDGKPQHARTFLATIAYLFPKTLNLVFLLIIIPFYYYYHYNIYIYIPSFYFFFFSLFFPFVSPPTDIT